MKVSLGSVVLFAVGILGDSNSISVTVPSGRIQGTQCDHSSAKSFLGIPFAKPPVGELRFMPPQLLTLANATFKDGILGATKFGSTCIQWKKTFAWEEPAPSEDW